MLRRGYSARSIEIVGIAFHEVIAEQVFIIDIEKLQSIRVNIIFHLKIIIRIITIYIFRKRLWGRELPKPILDFLLTFRTKITYFTEISKLYQICNCVNSGVIQTVITSDTEIHLFYRHVAKL